MNDNGQNMRIYSIIEQIEDAVENSPRPKIGSSAGKRIVEIEMLQDLFGDLKATIPEDIRRANSIMLQADTMLGNAEEHARELVEEAQREADTLIAASNEKSEQILANARSEYERLVSEDEIYQEAQRRAKLLAKKAEYNAGMLFNNAKVYADEVMADLERFLGEYQQQIGVNRRELDARAQQTVIRAEEVTPIPPVYPQQPPAAVQPPAAPQNAVKQPPVMQQPVQQQPVMQQPPMQQPPMQQPPMQQPPMMQQPMGQPPMGQRAPMGQPMQQPVQQEPPQRGRKKKVKEPKPIEDDYALDEYDDDDDFEDTGKKSLFSGLFKRKKKVVDDFEDDYE